MAIASLVLGILAIVVTFIPVIGIAAIFLAIIGIILGAIGKKKLKEAGAPTGAATAGLVLSIIALVFSSIFTIICGICAAGAANVVGLF